jgi:hypothetical protein
MSYAKGENTPARKRRRLPFRVVIEEREEPFLAADRAELEAECRRITNGHGCEPTWEWGAQRQVACKRTWRGQNSAL